MTLEEFLALTPDARPYGRGYRGACPSCGGRSGSTKFSFSERFAACTSADVCEVLGIRISDLFCDQGASPDEIRRYQAKRQHERAKAEVGQMAKGFQIDAIREAERFLKSTVGMDISILDEQKFDALMETVCGLGFGDERAKGIAWLQLTSKHTSLGKPLTGQIRRQLP